MSFVKDVVKGGIDVLTGGSVSARDAAKEQAKSASEGIAEVRRQFDAAQEIQKPYREFGQQAIDPLQALLSGETNVLDDPATQAALSDATRTINNRASQAGKYFQPRTTVALLGERDNILRARRTDRLNELFTQLGIGQATAVNQAAQAQTAGGQVADLMLERGNARASRQIATGERNKAAFDLITSFI